MRFTSDDVHYIYQKVLSILETNEQYRTHLFDKLEMTVL